MSVVPVECWLRTFRLEGAGGSASCFVISRHDRQWLVTAQHVIDAIRANGGDTLALFGEHDQHVELNAGLPQVPLGEPGPDVAVFALGDHKIAPDHLTLVPSSHGVALSQDAYFLGYPMYGSLPLAGRLPAVRRGIVSQRMLDVDRGCIAWILDGHNLPGFSGGPAVFADAGGTGSVWHVLGVVSGYMPHRINLQGPDGRDVNDGAFGVPTNSGIVVVHNIEHATEAIDAYVEAGN